MILTHDPNFKNIFTIKSIKNIILKSIKNIIVKNHQAKELFTFLIKSNFVQVS
jgi:hypothetical protein